MWHVVAAGWGDETVAQVERIAWEGPRIERGPDLVVREEPLEIRVNGAPVAVVMRTPGDDEDLVRGFLLSERIVASTDHIASVRPCRVVEIPEAEGNVVLATLSPEVEFDLARFRRNLYSTSSCGICGKASVALALESAPPLEPGPTLDPSLLRRLPEAMRETQTLFRRTGGLHAAAAFTARGDLLAAREDIGRHNAVDKVLGATAGRGLRPDVLVVSSRISFEIAQKALAGRIPVVVAVSAPSALAVELGRRSNMTIVAFARGERMVAYADEGRLGAAFAGRNDD